MSTIKQQLKNLKETDIYSLLLFALYKMIDIPEYSALSELAFLLDKENLLKLCETFGGCTITIPTIKELEIMLYALLLYQYTDIDNFEYEESIAKIGIDSKDLRKVKSTYNSLKNILSNYDLQPRG